MFVFKDDIHAGTKHKKKHCQKLQTRYNGPKQTQTKLQPGTTVPNAQETNYQKKYKHTLSENCSRLQSPCRHHFGNWQGYSAALGDEPSQLKKNITSHLVGGWNCTSEQRSCTVSFVPIICLKTFVCVSFHAQTQVVANRCALQRCVFCLES